jgi:hypothetical protein
MGFADLEHFFVITDEGLGVIHALLACKTDRAGFRRRLFYVKQSKLSQMWFKIHGAPVVDVKMVKKGLWNRQQVSQYIAGQTAIVRYGQSWQRSFGFPLIETWYAFKRWHRGRHSTSCYDLYAAWEDFISGYCMKYNDDEWSFDWAGVEGRYQRWRLLVKANGWQGTKHWTFGRWEIQDFAEPPAVFAKEGEMALNGPTY